MLVHTRTRTHKILTIAGTFSPRGGAGIAGRVGSRAGKAGTLQSGTHGDELCTVLDGMTTATVRAGGLQRISLL